MQGNAATSDQPLHQPGFSPTMTILVPIAGGFYTMLEHRFVPITALALATMLACPLPGQSQEELKQRKEHKLAAEFLKKATWFTDYDAAREAAKKRDQLIFAYFTRSYAG